MASTKKTNTNKKNDETYESSCSHGGKVKPWKVILGLILLPFALIYLPIHFGASSSYLPDLFLEPYWLFSLATLALVTIGFGFLKISWHDIKHKKITINIFVSLATIVSYSYSVFFLFFDYEGVKLAFSSPEEGTKTFFDSTIEILGIIYFGYYLEDVFTKKTQKEVASIFNLQSKLAIKLVNNKEIEVHPSDLKKGDIIVIKKGEKIPIDGIIIDGQTIIDESILTGESIPVSKNKNDYVLSGTIAEDWLKIKVTKTLDKSMLSQIIVGIENTKNQKTKTTKIADKIAKFILPLIFLSATTGLIIWGITSGVEKGIEVFITTLIISCPMSLVLMTPTSSLVSTSIAAKKGIVFNSNTIFEKAKKIDAIAFDKTGTLTEGKLKVVDNKLSKKHNQILFSIESKSSHPIAKAICKKYNNLDVIKKLEVKEIPGHGFEAKDNSKNYYVGSLTYLKSIHSNFSESTEINKKRKSGSLFIYLFDSKEVFGYVELKDTIKSSAKSTIATLRSKGISVYMISGDNKDTASFVANELNIEPQNVFANVLPNEKALIVKRIQSSKNYLAYVGDGINDSVALEQSDIGISMSSGSSVAIESSEISIQGNNLNLILKALNLSNRTLRTIYVGFFIAISYNIFVLSLALSGLLIPALAAVSMIINDTLPIMVSLTLFMYKFK